MAQSDSDIASTLTHQPLSTSQVLATGGSLLERKAQKARSHDSAFTIHLAPLA